MSATAHRTQTEDRRFADKPFRILHIRDCQLTRVRFPHQTIRSNTRYLPVPRSLSSRQASIGMAGAVSVSDLELVLQCFGHLAWPCPESGEWLRDTALKSRSCLDCRRSMIAGRLPNRVRLFPNWVEPYLRPVSGTLPELRSNRLPAVSFCDWTNAGWRLQYAAAGFAVSQRRLQNSVAARH